MKCVMSEPANPSGRESAPGLPDTLRFQRLANLFIRGLLRTPLVAQGIGGRLLTVYAVGRKSGRHYKVPVAYLSHEGSLLFSTPFPWVRNLRTGEPVDIRLKGKRRPADVEVIADEPGVVRLMGLIARDNRTYANFNKIGFTPDGSPNPDDLHRAWAGGSRVVRLTPR